MSNGVDRMKVAGIQGLISEVHAILIGLSNVNPVQLEAKIDASAALAKWEKNELFALQQSYQEVETS